jgi:methylated-DNA-[protein]-cysteine S-methyltransferase
MTLPRPTRDEALRGLPAEVSFDETAALLLRLAEDLCHYFDGEGVDLTDYPVDLRRHPPFHRRALSAARRIPYGEVRSYAWLAEAAGNPAASRAAGRAMSRNPLPLVIPCHRVVRADGALGGFGGGARMKRDLLELEGIRVVRGQVICDRRR